jgi:hypothetical protein
MNAEQLKALHEKGMVNLKKVGPLALGIAALGKVRRLGEIHVGLATARRDGPINPETSVIEHLQNIQSMITEAQTIIADLLLRSDLTDFLEYNIEVINLSVDMLQSNLNEIAALRAELTNPNKQLH